MNELATDDKTQQRAPCISDDDDDDDVTVESVHETDEATAAHLPETSASAAVDGGHDDQSAGATADMVDDASSDVRQRAMYARFRSWTQRNYGEAGKTKTVTRAKYQRVVAILSGAEPPTADNSKLRFWIKAKGFRLGYPVDTDPPTIVNCTELYIPSKTWVCLC